MTNSSESHTNPVRENRQVPSEGKNCHVVLNNSTFLKSNVVGICSGVLHPLGLHTDLLSGVGLQRNILEQTDLDTTKENKSLYLTS
jgi:hypothetical protein